MKRFLSFVCLVLVLGGCHRNTYDIEPKISHSVQDTYLKQLPSPFAPLSEAERSQDWGKEYAVGLGFAHQLELYQAMTAFKRAEILAPPSETKRLEELRYDIVLCYYLGQKYQDVVYEFEHGALRQVTQEFPAFHDLLVILYDSYRRLDKEEKATALLETIRKYYPDTAQRLDVSTALLEGNLSEAKHLVGTTPPPEDLQEFIDTYQAHCKSPSKARTLNAFFPGAGYLYVGQKQSALTSFLLNGLFIAATYQFYHHDHIAAGTIFLSFEMGWYLGGIVGAGLEAKSYNERVYEELATPMMNHRRYFPVLNLKYAF